MQAVQLTNMNEPKRAIRWLKTKTRRMYTIIPRPAFEVTDYVPDFNKLPDFIRHDEFMDTRLEHERKYPPRTNFTFEARPTKIISSNQHQPKKRSIYRTTQQLPKLNLDNSIKNKDKK